MRFKYPLQGDAFSDKEVKYLHVLFKKNPLFTFDNVYWLSKLLSDEELKNHLISVKVSRTKL